MLLEPNVFVFFLVTDQFEAKFIQSLFIVVFDMVQFLEADDSRIAVCYLFHDTGRSKVEIEHRFRCVWVTSRGGETICQQIVAHDVDYVVIWYVLIYVTVSGSSKRT